MTPPNYEAPDGLWYDTPEEYLWCGLLGGCGCGNSEELSELAYKILEHFALDHDKRTLDIYEKPEYEVIAHWLAHKDLTEHGGSVGGSWLSESGKSALEEIRKAKLEGK